MTYAPSGTGLGLYISRELARRMGGRLHVSSRPGCRRDVRPRAAPGVSVTARRFAAQLLAGRPARDPVAVAERLLAVQGQDPRGVRLAVRARTRGLTAADVDRAL